MWAQQVGNCSISGNKTTCGYPGIATFIYAPGNGNSAEMDVATNGTQVQYAGLVLNYGAGVNNVFVKVQQQDGSGEFNVAACYTGNNQSLSPFGLGFFDLSESFSTAHMRIKRAGNTVILELTNIDFGSKANQTYICEGAPPPEGIGIGIAGYNNYAQMDNFSVPRGPKVLLLEADYDEDGSSDIQSALEAFGDLGEVDLYDAFYGTPSLELLQYYDVVITWSNYSYFDAEAIGNVLADYVDAGGKVINSMFSIGDHGWEMAGRFISEGYTAINGTTVAYSTTCMDSFNGAHPVMYGLWSICDDNVLTETYTTPNTMRIASWDNGEVLVAVKNDRRVVTINAYFGNYHAYTGQIQELVHNAVYWLYSGNQVLWDQPVVDPDTNYANQDMPDYPGYSSMIADDFIVDSPWAIKTIFMPGGWAGPRNLANASEMHFYIYADDGGVPAGKPTGGGAPPIWSLSIPITDPQLTLYADGRDVATNVMLELTTPLKLKPGHYWLIGYPTLLLSPYGQYGRPTSFTTNGYLARWINPQGGFGHGSGWLPLSAIGAVETDAAFRIEGEAYRTFLPLILK